MLKAVEEIKKNSLFYPNVSHITCLAHALSLVACEVQSKYCLVNKYLSDCNKFLFKSNKRKLDFKAQTNHRLPPTPIQTRWGTWLRAADYHMKNYTKVTQFILSYKPDSKSEAFECIKKICAETKLKKDLFELRKYTPIFLTN